MKKIFSGLFFVLSFLFYSGAFSMQPQPDAVRNITIKAPGHPDLNLEARYNWAENELIFTGFPNGMRVGFTNASNKGRRQIFAKTIKGCSIPVEDIGENFAIRMDTQANKILKEIGHPNFARAQSCMKWILNNICKYGKIPVTPSACVEAIKQEYARMCDYKNLPKHKLFFRSLGELGLCYYVLSPFTSWLWNSLRDTYNYNIHFAARALYDPSSIAGAKWHDGPATRFDGAYALFTGLLLGLVLLYPFILSFWHLSINGIHAAEDFLVFLGKLIFCCMVGSQKKDGGTSH